MAISCAVIEDEPLARDVLTGFINEVASLELKATFKNGLEAYQHLQNDPIPLLFVDIQMPKLQGNELPNSLPYDPYIIFTTAYSEYALESFDYNTIDYLTKPIAFSRFLKAVNKVVQFTGEGVEQESPSDKNASSTFSEDDFLFLKFNHYYHKIYLNQIWWIEGLGDYQKIVTADQVYFYYSTLKDLAGQLPEKPFLRVHQSYIVNLNHVEGFQGNRLFIGDHEIMIGRRYQEEVKRILGVQ
jgi:two-component system LytT family response regulator